MIDYYLNETNEQRKYAYLREVKKTLRNVGNITLRNVVDLKRNVDNTFKNEPNYKNKKAKLTNLDKKRKDIAKLIEQTEKLISEKELTFFTTATDEELNSIIVQLKMQPGKCPHNLIEIERQIIDFLNQIQYQSSVIEQLRKIKYLKDQYILETSTDIKTVLETKLDSINKDKKSREEILKEILDGLVKESFIELENERTGQYKVLAAFKYIEQLLLTINISEEVQNEIPE